MKHVKFDQLGLMAIDPALSKHSDTNNDNGCPLFAFDQDANNCLEFMKSFLSPEYWPDRCSSKYNCCHLGCTYNCFNLKSHISYNLGSKFIHFRDEKALNANASSNAKIMKVALFRHYSSQRGFLPTWYKHGNLILFSFRLEYKILDNRI